ncbi:MAG: MgtC/SapB family protein [Desulfurobacteriaceae bacterium]
MDLFKELVNSEVWKLYQPYFISLIIGGLIGTEREFKKQREKVPFFGGIRTFILISLFGTLSAHVSDVFGVPYFFYIALASLTFLVAVAQYLEGLPGLTSEVSALITFTLGALCYKEEFQLAAFTGVLILFVLSFKEQMHSFVKHLTLEDLYAFLKFAAVTVIVYPLLPDQNFYGVNPREVWTMVVVISTIDFIGYVLTKLAGERGVLITGLIGGLVSSTAVTVTFSSLSKVNSALTSEYAAGIVGASAIMFPRMTFLSSIVSPQFAKVLLVPSFIAFLLGIFFAYRITRGSKGDRTEVKVQNPYELSTAVKFGIFYAFILFLSRNALTYFGNLGLYVVSAISGLSDVDAITLSVTKLFKTGSVEILAGVTAVLIAAFVNTVFKWFLTFSMGSRELFRQTTPGFIALILGEVIGVALLFWLK